MLQLQNRVAKCFVAIGMLVLIGMLTTSCIPNPFTRWPEAVIAIADDGTPYGTVPLTIVFDISGSYDHDGVIVSFTFDFGDGSDLVEGTDITQLIEHTYVTPGSYFAKLTVRDNGGARRSVWMAIQANPPAD